LLLLLVLGNPQIQRERDDSISKTSSGEGSVLLNEEVPKVELSLVWVGSDAKLARPLHLDVSLE
jgi:hypothetical protein